MDGNFIEKVNTYQDYLEFVRLLAFMREHVGGEWKYYYKKAQRKLAKYQRNDFENVVGDLACTKPLRVIIRDKYSPYLMSYLRKKYDKELITQYY